MRRKSYINQINNKDIKFLHALRCCNHLSKEQAENLISRGRINNFVKQGVIQLVHTVRCNRTVTAYAITPEGRRWANRNVHEMQGRSWYQAARAIEHNLRLAEHYLKITRQYPDCHILTEGDLRDYLQRQIENRNDRYQLLDDLRGGKISVPDMGYIANGEISCIEVVNGHYGQAEMQAKEAFEQITSINIDFVRQ